MIVTHDSVVCGMCGAIWARLDKRGPCAMCGSVAPLHEDGGSGECCAACLTHSGDGVSHADVCDGGEP